MIKVKYGTTTNKNQAIIDEQTIVRDFMTDKEMNYRVTGGNTTDVTMSGKTLRSTDLDKSFATLFQEFGLTDSCFLLSVKNVDNA